MSSILNIVFTSVGLLRQPVNSGIILDPRMELYAKEKENTGQRSNMD